jgi:hypothetical protein
VEEALALGHHFAVARGIASSSLALARVSRLEGRLAESRTLLDEAARIMRSLDDVGGLAHIVVERALGVAASSAPDYSLIVRLITSAHAVRQSLGMATPGSEERHIAAAMAKAQAALTFEGFEAARQEGARANIERLSELAMSAP